MITPADKEVILKQISGLLYEAEQYHQQALILFQKYQNNKQKVETLQKILDDC